MNFDVIVFVILEIVGMFYVVLGFVVVGVLVVVLLIVDGFLLIIISVLFYDVYYCIFWLDVLM